MRHRSASYNEMSARYMPLPNENYIPSGARIYGAVIKAKNSTNKQEQGIGDADNFDESDVLIYQNFLAEQYHFQQLFYESCLKKGIPKELARIHLPVGRYSVMRVSANLRNWLSFLALRNDEAAQYEIRVYAEALQEILEVLYPRTMDLFINERT